MVDFEAWRLGSISAAPAAAPWVGEGWNLEATVKAQVSSILAKIAASNRVQAAILAHDAGLLDR